MSEHLRMPTGFYGYFESRGRMFPDAHHYPAPYDNPTLISGIARRDAFEIRQEVETKDAESCDSQKLPSLDKELKVLVGLCTRSIDCRVLLEK